MAYFNTFQINEPYQFIIVLFKLMSKYLFKPASFIIRLERFEINKVLFQGKVHFQGAGFFSNYKTLSHDRKPNYQF